MSEYHVTFEDGAHRVYGTENGVDKRLLGPRWASPRQAMAYAELQSQLDARPTPSRAAEVSITSPRVSCEEPQPSRSVPDAAPTSQRSRASG